MTQLICRVREECTLFQHQRDAGFLKKSMNNLFLVSVLVSCTPEDNYILKLYKCKLSLDGGQYNIRETWKDSEQFYKPNHLRINYYNPGLESKGCYSLVRFFDFNLPVAATCFKSWEFFSFSQGVNARIQT